MTAICSGKFVDILPFSGEFTITIWPNFWPKEWLPWAINQHNRLMEMEAIVHGQHHAATVLPSPHFQHPVPALMML